MNILAIESSCDETAAALIKNGTRVVADCVSTQIPIHKKYSGVVPELASRAHVEMVNAVVEKTLAKTKLKPDVLAVTVGPGLVGSLLVGKMTAETLGWIWNKPVVGINHIEGHLLSPILADPKLKPPFVGLVVSGGHTEIIYAKGWGQYYLVGRTRDDAAGEAFDKVAKMLQLGYPGGPIIDRLAQGRDPQKMPFPIPWMPKTWEFSFSGLKTAVLYKLRTRKKWSLSQKKDLCAGFQNSIVEVLVAKTVQAAQALGVNQIIVGGGVAANSCLREKMKKTTKMNDIKLLMPPIHLCTDNAAMIGAAAYFKLCHKARTAQRSSLRVTSSLHIPYIKQKMPDFRPLLSS